MNDLTKQPKRRFIQLVFFEYRSCCLLGSTLAWLLISLACNFPTAQGTPSGISRDEILQTMAAMDGATLTISTSTPEPDASPLATPPGLTESPTFFGLQTATPGELPSLPAFLTGTPPPSPPIEYQALPGDTLETVAHHFGVEPGQIASSQDLPPTGYLTPGQPLVIPAVLGETPFRSALLPDSEVILSPSSLGFDLPDFVEGAGGYLSTYEELVGDRWLDGRAIIQQVALETSVNPRLLLAFLEFRSGWVLGEPMDPERIAYPIGFFVPGHRGLYQELTLAANHLNIGYYDWRAGKITHLRFQDRRTTRLSPELNAGSVALQNLFAKFFPPEPWGQALYGPDNFLLLYQRMFGDPWARAAAVEPLLHPGVAQPAMELPFAPGEPWSFTGGPHKVWSSGSPLGALDFGPAVGERRCAVSRTWVTAPAAGVVVRSQDNFVTLDLDGDGHEGTGWVLFFYHIADSERVAAGSRLAADAPIGHPSCEGGSTTGTHVHLARKYNGEWMAADGPVPFLLSGWRIRFGARPYEGTLSKEGQIVTANPGGSQISIITR